jgi:hypothetical protein
MQNPTSGPFVPRPDELSSASLFELADAYHGHLTALVNHERHIGRLRASALGALAIGEQLIRQMLADRCYTVRDALRFGATVDHVAVALGVAPGDVIIGMTVWAHGQATYGRMTDEQHAEMFELLQLPRRDDGRLTAEEIAALDAEADRRLGRGDS